MSVFNSVSKASKKRAIVIIAIVIVVVALAAGLYYYRHHKYPFDFYGFSDEGKIPELKASLIEKIDFGKYEFTESEIEEFTTLFNESQVRIREGGSTEQYSVSVILKDCPDFHLNYYAGSCFSLTYSLEGKLSWYINNGQVLVLSDGLTKFFKARLPIAIGED